MAIGVEFTSRDVGVPKTVKAKKEVILSAGTIHTPQVLQLSGIGDRRLLEEAGIEVVVDLPGVGQNFQDHALLNVPYRCEFFLEKGKYGIEFSANYENRGKESSAYTDSDG